MASAPVINYLRSADFTGGFSSWHIRWSVKKNALERSQNLQSAPFATVMNRNGLKSMLAWRCLMHKDDGDGENLFFGLLCTEAGGATAVIQRMAMYKPDDDPLFNVARVVVMDRFKNQESSNNCFWASISENVFNVYAQNVVVLHCWIELPRQAGAAVLGQLDGSYPSIFPEIITMVSHFGALFAGVLDQSNDMKSLSDVILTAPNGDGAVRSFYCHRSVLVARSSVFRCMFVGENWKESANKNDTVVEIDDIGAETMRIILEHIYTGSCTSLLDTDYDHVLDVLRAADKYDLPTLMEYCSSILIALAGNEDWDRVQHLIIADRYRLGQLKSVCIAALSTDLSILNTVESSRVISEELWLELRAASDKRHQETVEITVNQA